MKKQEYKEYSHDFHVSCQCNCSVVKLTYDEDFPSEIFMSIYHSTGHRFGIIAKIKLLFYYLKHGHPYKDEIILTGKDIIGMANFLKTNYYGMKKLKISAEKAAGGRE